MRQIYAAIIERDGVRLVDLPTYQIIEDHGDRALVQVPDEYVGPGNTLDAECIKKMYDGWELKGDDLAKVQVDAPA